MEILKAAIEHLSWPLTVLICVLLFQAELRALIRRLRGFKAGSIELQLHEQLAAQGISKEQLALLTSLSADDVELFFLVSYTDSVGFNYTTGLPPDVFKARLLSLRDSGLLDVSNPEDIGVNLRHNLTPLGCRIRAMLIGGATQLLRGQGN